MRTLNLSAILCTALASSACSVTSHPVGPATLGTPRADADLEALIDTPSEVRLETVNSADWAVDRSGLINLDHAAAEEAGLQDGDEPIQIYFHVLTHPTRGTFLIDTGVESALRDDPEHAALRGMAASAFHVDRMQIHAPLGAWLAQHEVQPAGVLFTHLHADHVLGLPDVPRGTPLYAGPGDAAARSFMNLAAQPTMNRLFAGQATIQELALDATHPVLDLFGDGTVWALHMPGHTPGSVAYLVRTQQGPVLLTGDTCHTAWGWEHGVEPGTFTSDHAENARSLAVLKRLVRAHPAIQVRLGHQALVPATEGFAREPKTVSL